MMHRMIHPSAVIHPAAELGSEVRVGPCAVIDAGVKVGDGCDIGPHVYLTGETEIGSNNRFHAGCVIGDSPQDVRYRGEPTRVIIGEHNTFREHVTVHRSNKVDEPTRIGCHNLLMAHCHVGHNTLIGDQVIIANGALLGGHTVIQDRVFISGNCLVHQFVRVGTLALMQGGSGISKDLPPYTVARGNNTICGLNTIGLRRAGLSSEERMELRRLYHQLFRGRQRLSEALAAAEKEVHSPHARVLLEFLRSGKRGFCAEVSQSRADPDEE